MTNKYKIIELIKSFSSIERKELVQYLQINHSKSKIQDLIIFIIEDKKIESNQSLFQILYPKDVYNDIRIRKLYSRTKLVLIEFTSYIQSKSELSELSSYKYLSKKSNQGIIYELNKKIKTSTELDLNSNKYQFELDFSLSIMDEILLKDNRAQEPKYQDAHYALDAYYLIEKLKLSCSSLSYTKISGNEYDIKLIEELEPYLAQYNLQEKTMLYLFYHLYLMIKYQSSIEFEIIFQYLSTNTIHDNEDFKEILTQSINFCIQLLNRGNRDILPKLFRLYQLQIESKNIYILDKILPTSYKNISNLALQIKEYQWVNQFIESHKVKIKSAHPEEDYQFVKARYYYETEKYKECIQLIAISRPQDLLNNLSMRVLQCKAYYEMDEYEMIDLTIHNASLYLHRHKSKTYQYSLFKNFFKLLKKILQSSHTIKGTAKLSQELIETKLVAERPWLTKLIHTEM